MWRMKRPGQIYISVDNALTKLKINWEEVNLSGFRQDWSATNQLYVFLQQDDLIEVSADNWWGWSENNPWGILAQINYVDDNGDEQRILTNDKWVCDWWFATSQGRNDWDTVWKRAKGGKQHDVIPWEAEWIWYQNVKKPSTTCSTYLNKEQNGPRASPGKIYVSVDDVLNSISVNG